MATGELPYSGTVAPSFTPSRETGLPIDKLAIQDINAIDYASPIQDVFKSQEVTNGYFIEDIIMQQAKEGATFTQQDIDSASLNEILFAGEDYNIASLPKISYLVKYDEEDFRRWLKLGISDDNVKNMVAKQLAGRRDFTRTISLANAIQNNEKSVLSSATSAAGTLTTYSSSTATLKDIIFNTQQLVNCCMENGHSTRAYAYTASGTTTYLDGSTPHSEIVVFMSETLFNQISTYCKSGVYNLDKLVEDYKVVLIPDYMLKHEKAVSSITTTTFDADGFKRGGSAGSYLYYSMYNPAGATASITPSSNTVSVDNTYTVYVMDRRHIKPIYVYDRMFVHRREGNDDVVVGIYDRSGVFVSSLYSSVIFNAAQWKGTKQ